MSVEIDWERHKHETMSRLEALLRDMDDIAANHAGSLSYRHASMFHAAMDQIRKIVKSDTDWRTE